MKTLARNLIFTREGFDALLKRLDGRINRLTDKKIREISIIEDEDEGQAFEGQPFKAVIYKIEKKYYR